MEKIMKNIDILKDKSRYIKEIDGKQYIVHLNKACKQSGGTIVKNKQKIKKFIKEEKVPNGTNDVFI